MNVVTESYRAVMEAPDRIRAAQDLLQTNRVQGLSLLNEIFRNGQPPSPPLDGAYDGELVALETLGFTVPFARTILAMWLPWRGKYLVAAESLDEEIDQFRRVRVGREWNRDGAEGDGHREGDPEGAVDAVQVVPGRLGAGAVAGRDFGHAAHAACWNTGHAV